MTDYTENQLLDLWRHDASCGNCGAPMGEEHHEDCEVVRCLTTGRQRFICREPHDCGRARHDGFWPGEPECAQYGWYELVDGQPEAALNYLLEGAVWDADKRRLVKRPETDTRILP